MKRSAAPSPRPSRSWPLTALLVLALGLVSLAGCDSSEEESRVTEVTGTYSFTQLRFVPDAPALAPINLMNRLVPEETELRLLGSGQFTLFYQFEDGVQSQATGTFTATDERVRLNVDEEDQDRLADVLLGGEQLTFTRADGVLTLNQRKTIDPRPFGPEYTGIASAEGVLDVQLIRQ